MERYYVQLHLLESCNLQCIHCYQEGERKEQLSFEECMKLFDDIEEMMKNRTEKVQVNLTGGEPLLYPDLLKVIDEINHRKWTWALLTNGTLLTSAMVKQLALRKPVFIQVSLDGDEKMNDEIRGKGTFAQITSAIKLLKTFPVKVLVSFTVNSKNYKSFPAVTKVARKLDVDKVWCDRYVGNDALKISTHQFQEFLKLLQRETKRKSWLHKTKVKAERSLQFLIQPKDKKIIYQCGAGKNLIVITANGDILPCRRLPIVLGNIKEDNLSLVLQKSEVFQRLQQHSIPDSCIRCRYKRECRGGARCVTYAQTGSFGRKDVNCWL